MVINAFLRFNDTKKPTKDDIRAFLHSVQTTPNKKNGEAISIHTQHIYFRSLKTFFTWMVTEKAIKVNPMSEMKAPRLPKLVITPLNNDDLHNLMVATSGDRFVDVRNRALVSIFLDTCVRLEEMSRIKLNDIDMTRDIITIYGKGNKQRYLKIGKNAKKAVLSYLMRRDEIQSDSLWLSEERKPFTARGIQVQIRRLLGQIKAHSSKQGAHILRHTGAILFLRNGGDIFTLQMMLGHSTLEMTRRYLSSLGVDDLIRVHLKASPMDNIKW